MKFNLMVYENDFELSARTDPDRKEAYWAAYTKFTNALNEAGVMAGGACTQPPSTAQTVRIADGKLNVVDGPHAPGPVQLGGYYTIDVESLDEAIKWAEQCPSAVGGGVEVRALMEM